MPIYCSPVDLVDADEEFERTLLGTGFFELAPYGTPEEGGEIITQQEIVVSEMIDAQTPRKRAHVNHARNQAILKAIENAGGVEKLSPELRDALEELQDSEDLPAAEIQDGDSEAAA